MRKAIYLAGALLLASAGPALAAAKGKVGDIDLRFRTQIENDFEFRDNYDFDDRRATVPDDSRDDLFVETETRFGMDGSAGNWRTHVLLEQETRWDRNAEGGGSEEIGLERAWMQYNFGPFTLRAGPSELFTLDPLDLVYSDDDPMVRAFGKTANFSWQVGFSIRQDDGGAAPLNNANTRNLDQRILHGSATFPIKTQGVNLNLTPFVLYNHHKVAPDPVGTTLETFYLGVGTKGTVGGVTVLGEFVYLTGTDETSRNSLLATAGNGTEEIDVNAWAAILALAYPIPNSPFTIEVGGVWSSGDDDPTDQDAEGFTGIFHDTEALNPDGIWVDDDIRVVARNPFTGADIGAVRVKEDDKYWTTLVSGGLPQSIGNLEDFNLSNPGIQIYHVALHYKATPNLNISGIFEHPRLFEDVVNVAGVAGFNVTEKDLANEFAIRAVWKPEKYVTITPEISYVIPSDAVRELVGQDDSAFNGIVEVKVNF